MNENSNPDVVIIGGGAAGSSAAMVLGRARASVLLIDAGDPSNAPSTGIGGLLGHDGTPPAEFYALVASQLAVYPTIERRVATVVAIEPGGDLDAAARWSVELDDGSNVSTDRILLAMGMRYAVPAIEGIGPLWGASVFHCPFCHGWEHRDRPMVVLGDGEMSVERAVLLSRWTDDITLVTGGVALSDEERGQVDALGIRVADGTVAAVVGEGRELSSVVLSDGTSIVAGGMLVPAPHEQRLPGLVEALGAETTPMGHVAIDMFGATSVPGVWAAGDITSPMASVARVIGEGSMTAAGITRDMVMGRLAA